VHCHDEAASHHLPKTVAIFFLLHPSAGEGLRCSNPKLLSGLEECTSVGQYLRDDLKKRGWGGRGCQHCSALAAPPSDVVETQATSVGKTGLLFQGHSHRAMTHLWL